MKKDWVGMLDELLLANADEGCRLMSEWEVQFIESLNNQREELLEDGLSSTQWTKLREIWEEIFG